jgi:hypothetical protein
MRRNAALATVAVVGLLAAALVGIGTTAAPAAAAPAPSAWCGPAESAVDLPDTVGGPQVHVIYAYPADGADAFGRWATPIARDMAAIDTWWQGQDPTRTLRFDLADFPRCDSAFGRLDLSSVRLPGDAAHYRVDESDVIVMLAADLRGIFGSDAKKYLVYYDGPVDSGAVCGRGVGGPYPGASAVIYLQSDAPCVRAGGGVGAPGGGLSAYIAAHELLHTLDIGPEAGPHRCDGDPARHYCDNPSDILAPTAGASSRLATAVLDAGRDDYYGTGNSSDLRASPFLVHLDGPTVHLAAVVPTGGGRVTSDVPGLVCPDVCELPFDGGVKVGLVAQPDPGYAFAGWSGACSGIAPTCTTTLAGETSVTARFGRPGRVQLRVAGRGTVDGCRSSCARAVVSGQELTLRAAPRQAQRFRRWEGACSGPALECTFTAQPGAVVRAVFTS